MEKNLALLGLLLWAVSFGNLFAHRDEVSARRFRELNPHTVAGELDKLRNRRWHTLGLVQRLAFNLGAANICGLYLRSWPAFWVALGLGFLTLSLVFDIVLNVRLGLHWAYLGTTSKLDGVLLGVGSYLSRLLGRKTDPAAYAPGALAAFGEGALVLLGIAAWYIFV